ncbi:MAG: hypothetical protein AAFS01_00465 [Pseudomonadota bacterium]
MYERTHRNTVTFIIVFGHIFLFLYAFLAIGIAGGQIDQDFFQLILMASPVLASTALLGFKDLVDRRGRGARGKKLPSSYLVITLALPLILIVLVGAVFTLFANQYNIASPNDLKISLGVIETFFGGYIGVLAKSLYGS